MNATRFIRLSEAIEQAYVVFSKPILHEFDIPQISFDIIMFLANNPEFTTAQEICNVKHLKKNLASLYVDKLVQGGYLERGHIEGDRRKIALIVTEKAKPIVERGREMQKKFLEGMTKGMSDEDLEQYRNFLLCMEANARALAEEAGDVK